MYNTIFPQTLSVDTEVLWFFYYANDKNLPSKGIYKSNYFLTCELKTFWWAVLRKALYFFLRKQDLQSSS